MTFTLTTTIEHDSSHGAPWEECDGHGIVSEWTTRAKEALRAAAKAASEA